MPLRLLIAGDIRLYRDGLALHLAGRPGFAVAGTAGDRGEALRAVLALRPDVLLLDMAMRESLAAVRDVAAAAPETRIVALALPEVERDVLACAEAGIAGFVPREGSLDDLERVVESVARGELIVSPRMAASLLRRVTSLAAAAPAAGRPPADLTARESEIMTLVEEGLSNKQIAGRLCISVATVKNHVHNALEKLHVHRRADAARARRASHHLPTSRSELGGSAI